MNCVLNDNHRRMNFNEVKWNYLAIYYFLTHWAMVKCHTKKLLSTAKWITRIGKTATILNNVEYLVKICQNSSFMNHEWKIWYADKYQTLSHTHARTHTFFDTYPSLLSGRCIRFKVGQLMRNFRTKARILNRKVIEMSIIETGKCNVKCFLECLRKLFVGKCGMRVNCKKIQI